MVFWTLIVCLLLLCGISIFCIWECFRMKARYEGYSSFMISRMATTTGVIIALFIVVVILAMTALVSVILDCYPMLIIHAYIFIVLSFVMFSIGMFGVIQNRDQDGKGSYLIKSLADLESVLERPDWFSFNHTILDPIQKELRCCGVYNWNDYWRPLKRTSWIGISILFFVFHY